MIDKSNILNLSVEDFTKFKEHIEVCKVCRNIYEEYSDIHTILKMFFKNIPINTREKQQALILIEKYTCKKPLFYPIPTAVFAIFILLISFGIFRYIQYTTLTKQRTDFITNLIYISNDKNLKWVNTKYNNPLYKKLKKCKSCKYTKDIKLLKFKVKNNYISLFILKKQKFLQLAGMFRYYDMNNKYVYICNTHAELIHIWISDISINEITRYLIHKCRGNMGNTLKIKSKKLGCPFCITHLIKNLRKYKSCILDIDYQTSEIILNILNHKRVRDIEELFL